MGSSCLLLQRFNSPPTLHPLLLQLLCSANNDQDKSRRTDISAQIESFFSTWGGERPPFEPLTRRVACPNPSRDPAARPMVWWWWRRIVKSTQSTDWRFISQSIHLHSFIHCNRWSSEQTNYVDNSVVVLLTISICCYQPPYLFFSFIVEGTTHHLASELDPPNPFAPFLGLWSPLKGNALDSIALSCPFATPKK